MTIDELHDASNARLWDRLPVDQRERVLKSDLCDIGPEFLGFVGIYERLAQIIPEHFTVIDLGCAYAPQALFFDRHQQYIGVDMLTPLAARFDGPNVRHYHMPICEFIERHGDEFSQGGTFAICSYVPPWRGDNMKIARGAFKNVFTYYPGGDQ